MQNPSGREGRYFLRISMLERAIRDQLGRLPIEKQRQVLEYAHALASTQVRGIPGSELARFAGAINPSDLVIMSKAIEDDCEQVNPDEW